jgi:branched-subunit amino acid ABC-type transport system permease component
VIGGFDSIRGRVVGGIMIGVTGREDAELRF